MVPSSAPVYKTFLSSGDSAIAVSALKLACPSCRESARGGTGPPIISSFSRSICAVRSGLTRPQLFLRLHRPDLLPLHRIQVEPPGDAVLRAHQQRMIVDELRVHPVAAAHVIGVLEGNSVAHIGGRRSAPASVILQAAAHR